MAKCKLRWSFFWYMILLFVPVSGQGAPIPEENLFICDSYDFLLTNCRMAPLHLANTPSFGGEDFFADFIVTYSFPCVGTSGFSVGVRSGENFNAFQPHLSGPLTLKVSGSSALETWDNDPVVTSEMSFSPGCRLIVHAVAFEPSFHTLLSWSRLALTQSQLIRSLLHLWQMSGDYLNYLNWNQTQMTSMLGALDQRVSLFSRQCEEGNASSCSALLHFRIIRNAVKTRIDSQPAPDPDSLEEHFDAVRRLWFEELVLAAEYGRFMQARFQHWQKPGPDELREALLNAGQI